MKEKIVIIEDDRDILDILTYIFQNEGFNVSGYDAVGSTEQLIRQKPDLFLMDLWLKGTSGEHVIDTLKHDERTRKTPILLLTAVTRGREIAKELSVDGYLDKPFDYDRLIEKVNELLVH